MKWLFWAVLWLVVVVEAGAVGTSELSDRSSCARLVTSWGKRVFQAARPILRRAFHTRYDVSVSGYEQFAEVSTGPTGPILFLANHPTCFVEPAILFDLLLDRFQPKFMIDEAVLTQSLMGKWVQLGEGAIPVPLEGAGRVRALVTAVKHMKEKNGHLFIFPSGQVSRDGREELAENAAVAGILRRVPGVRIVVIKVKGLYGSRFSHGWEQARAHQRGWSAEHDSLKSEVHEDPLQRVVRTVLVGAAVSPLNGFLFGPRRPVQIEFDELTVIPDPQDLPALNAHIAQALNSDDRSPLFVPLSHFGW